MTYTTNFFNILLNLCGGILHNYALLIVQNRLKAFVVFLQLGRPALLTREKETGPHFLYGRPPDREADAVIVIFSGRQPRVYRRSIVRT